MSGESIGFVHEQSKEHHVYWAANQAFRDMMQRCHDADMSEEKAFWCAVECREIFLERATALLNGLSSFQAMKGGSVERPNKRDPFRAVVINAMSKARREGQSLPDFIASMESRSVEGISACEKDGDSYRLTLDEVEAKQDAKCVARRTMDQWWAEAGKGRRTSARV